MNDLDDWDYAASRLLKAQAEATRLEAEIERLRGLVTKYEAEMATCESCSEALYEGAKLVPLRTADQPEGAPRGSIVTCGGCGQPKRYLWRCPTCDERLTDQQAVRLPGESQQHANERIAWERNGPLTEPAVRETCFDDCCQDCVCDRYPEPRAADQQSEDVGRRPIGWPREDGGR
jgi:RNase P subunit RPR2